MPLATVAFSLHLHLYMFPIFSLLSCSSIGHWSDEGGCAMLHSTAQHGTAQHGTAQLNVRQHDRTGEFRVVQSRAVKSTVLDYTGQDRRV
jgi:hypothetical protein